LAGITLERGLSVAASAVREQGVDVPEQALADALEFTVRRYEQQLLDSGYEHAYVTAVLPLAGTPAAADETLVELGRRSGDAGFAELVAALQRVRRIVPAETPAVYDPTALTEPEELALSESLAKVRESLSPSPSLAEFADAASALVGPVHAFFDAVLVMAEDPALRAARLGLLATIRDLAAPVLDWDALSAA
jgi:glycyl-tRNA synthetase